MRAGCAQILATAFNAIIKSILREATKATKEDTSTILQNGMTNLLEKRIFYSIDSMSACEFGKFFNIILVYC